jgi:signal transduction histidine kinase
MDHRSPNSANSPRAVAPAAAAEPPRPALRARAQRWLGRWTLRRKLLAGFTISLLPLIALLAFTLDQRFTTRRAEELRSNREFAEAVVATFDGYLSDIDHQLLAQAFTLGWRFDLDNLPVVQAYLALNRAPYPNLAALALTDLEGHVIAADPPDALGPSLIDEPYFRAARDSRDPVVSDLLPAPGRAAPWFTVARPVQRLNGEVLGVLVAYLDAGSLGSVLRLDRLGRAGYTIVDRQLRVVYDSQHPTLTWEQRDASAWPHVRAAARGQDATTEGFTSRIDGARRLGAAAPLPRLGWIATADRLVAEAFGPIEDAARREAAISALAVLLALALALVLAVSLTEPLRTLQRAVAAVRQGDYGQRVPVLGRDELAELAAGFNDMVARLEALEHEREAFAAMIAHDLRSPLTTVRGTAELLSHRTPEELAAVQQGLATIMRESDRVARLADDLGDSARAATGHLEIRPERVDLAALVAEAIERLRAAGAGQPIHLDAPRRPLWVDADPGRIAQVLDNLLTNAAKYSPGDQPILVRVLGGGEARVIVEDRGPGIAAEDLPHLFDRFYRTRRARSGHVAGTGLGLYISQEIATSHHGHITVDSAPGRGSRFTLTLPLAPTPAPAR